MLNQTLLKYYFSWCVVVLFSVTIQAQTIENQRISLHKRSRTVDKHFYLDSLITFTEEGSEAKISAHILKAELLKSEEKYVNALSELMLVSTDISTSEYPDLLGISYLEISEIYMEKGSYDEAKEYLVEAYTLFNNSRDKEKKAVVLIKSAHVAKKMSDYEAAISHLKNAHAIYSESGKNLIVDEISKEIGTLAYEAGDFLMAKNYLNLALAGFEVRNDHREQIRIYEALSKIYEFENDEVRKIEMLEKVFELAEANSSKETIIQKGNELVLAYSKANRNRDALRKHIEIIDLMQGSRSVELYLAEIKLCSLYELSGRETEAISALHRANNLAVLLDSTELILNSSKHISEFYRLRGDYERAHKQLVIHDSLLEQNLAELKENRARISTNEASEASGDATIISSFGALDTFWKVTILGGFLLLLGTFITFIFILRKKAKVKRILEWKMYKRTKEIRTLNAELNTYIYRSSHDLRNPLTSIKSLISLLLKEEHNETSSRYLGLIENCTDQMDEILLNLSRAVDYKKVDVNIQQVSFSQIMNEIKENYSEGLKGLKLDWEIREKAPFFSDPSLIKIILNKTITNSIQYRLGSSSDYCKISIVTDSKGAQVSIEDNGQGISEKVKDRVFDMFEKGTHKSKGAGLGLYLVKIVSEKIRAKITLESMENQGAKLDFKLPNLSS